MADLISTEAAVKLTGYSRSWIKRLLQHGKVSGFKISERSWVIEKQSLLDYQEKQKSKK